MTHPYVEIIEQPKSTALRFRYITESRKAGSIMGEHSSRTNQSFPAIKIHNYFGPLVAKMFCVTEQGHLHPHKLVGQNCNDDHGVCIIRVNDVLPDNIIRFSNVGIQCSKRDDIRAYLEAKKKMVPECHEPPNLTMIDLTCVKLMFKVYVLPGDHQLDAVMSRVIYDKKHCCDLTITRLSIKSAPADGNEELFILCNRIKKEDLQVVFSTNSWEGLGSFYPGDVFKECVVVCKVPPFKNINIMDPVDVKLFLRQPSTKEIGNELTFTYRPVDHDPFKIDAKRRKMADLPSTVGISFNPLFTNQLPSSVPPFPDIILRPDSQDHGASRPMNWQGNFIHPNTFQSSRQVSGPDIFRREDRNTTFTFYDQLHSYDNNNPFLFSSNQGPPVPLHVEEVNSKGRNDLETMASNFNQCNSKTPSQQLIGIKSESTLGLEQFMPKNATAATNAYPSTMRSKNISAFGQSVYDQNANMKLWNARYDTSKFSDNYQNSSSAMNLMKFNVSSTHNPASNQVHPSFVSSNQMQPLPVSSNQMQPLPAPYNQMHSTIAQFSHANPLLAPSTLEAEFEFEDLAFPELGESLGSLNLEDVDPNIFSDFLSTGS